MKTLIMMSAIPASGKSTWANEYNRTHENVYILNSDDVRMELTGGVYKDRSKQKEVWELFDKRIHEYAYKAENVTVILDALNDTNEIRLKYLSTTPEYDHKILVLFPNSNLKKAKEYNNMRPVDRRVPDQVMDMFDKKFEAPSKEVLDLVDEVIEVVW